MTEFAVPARRRALWMVALACLVAAVRIGVLKSEFVFDDHLIVANARASAHPHGALSLLAAPYFSGKNYRPLTNATFHGTQRAFGEAAWPHRALNLALHVMNTLLLFALARRLGASQREAGLGAAIWGVHPLHVEPIVGLLGRGDLLSSGALLGAVWIAAGRDSRHPGKGRALGIAALFLAGLAAK